MSLIVEVDAVFVEVRGEEEEKEEEEDAEAGTTALVIFRTGDVEPDPVEDPAEDPA